jgi:hypothetical protein
MVQGSEVLTEAVKVRHNVRAFTHSWFDTGTEVA